MNYKLSSSLTIPETELISNTFMQYDYCAYTGDNYENDIFCLCYKDCVLIGYAYCILFDEAEISGFVIPDYRRRGIFTHMVSLLTKGISVPIVFSGRDSYEGFKQCAFSFNATQCITQHLMKYDSSLYTPLSALNDYEIEKHGQEETWFFFMDDDELGQASLFIEDNTINIFNVYMKPDRRGMGYSKKIISTILLLSPPGKNIVLQVSSDNIPAFRLYRSCGFRSVDSVTYYSCPKECAHDSQKRN